MSSAPLTPPGPMHDHRPDPVVSIDYEERARGLLPPHISAYIGAAAGSGGGSAEGTADWSAVRFRPRALQDLRTIDTRTTVLGTPVETPVLVAPMAQQLGAHPEGEAVMARAAAAAGSLLGVSTNVAVPFSTIAAAGAPWWFQVYVMRDHGLTELLVRRAVEHGARALLLTVDMVALLPATVNPRQWPEGPAKSRLTNLTAAELAAAGPGAVDMDAGISLATIGWLREMSGLPVLVKGVLRGDDAAACVDAGAAGVIVSTHGGRRLGPSVTAARALPEVVAAVGDAGEVYADSGLRSAEHVAAALALGARAVFVGRPALWALAADGETGVQTVLDGLTGELRQVMTQLGAPSLDRLTRDLVA
ncbi:4-hydroxymandelate oxidase [Friedmanniella luteola]|uniref:4-hydroxymandelate oxidase n=1 Tax=Friedmanniella luteola TaxID=546871 RepID=A0A1H1Z563_9ACTN|nr:alpha-hydroxy acid oxidase [Friedmanniella luteola]SDT28955.1 4-hydroxymandelate oxidase [Friedmanniella luteola]